MSDVTLPDSLAEQADNGYPFDYALTELVAPLPEHEEAREAAVSAMVDAWKGNDVHTVKVWVETLSAHPVEDLGLLTCVLDAIPAEDNSGQRLVEVMKGCYHRPGFLDWRRRRHRYRIQLQRLYEERCIEAGHGKRNWNGVFIWTR